MVWIMGTDYIYERGGMALFNCCFVEVEDLVKDCGWLMDTLMCGCGTGFGLSDTSQTLYPLKHHKSTFVIPDSREGWVESVQLLLAAYLDPEHGTDWTFDYSKIRPYGAPLKGFGGLASGHGPLKTLHQRIRHYCEDYIANKINWIHLTANICNAIGACVVAGNIRRSAEICLGSPSDETFLDLKDYSKYPERMAIGWMSNNSVRLHTRNDFLKLGEISERIKKNGEPGILNMVNIQKFGRFGHEGESLPDPAKGINPCGEIPLESYEVCNLAEVFPSRCGSRKEFLSAVSDATFYSSTVSLYPTHSPDTNSVVARNRRIGVSLSGIAEWVDTWGVARCTRWIRDGYHLVREVNKTVNNEAGVVPSIRVSTVKPSGCRPKSAITSTSKGIFTLEELLEGHPEGTEWKTLNGLEVLQLCHEASITKTYRNGISETIDIHLSYGMKLTSTPNHQWFVSKTKKHSNRTRWKEVNEWKRADELTTGDVIDITLEGYRNYKHKKLFSIKNTKNYHFNTTQIKQPLYMSPDLSWLLGYLWGDGSMSPLKFRLRWTDERKENLEKVQRILLEQFGLEAKIHPASQKRNVWIVEVGSHALWDWCLLNGIWKYTEDGGLADIPRVVRESSHEHILAFIAGLVDSDGCFSISSDGRYRFCISTASKAFSEHLQHVCWSVGIGVGNSLNTKGENKQEIKEMRSLTLASTYFDETCLQILVDNSNKLEGEAYQYKGKGVTKLAGKVEKLEQGKLMETFDIETENHWYYAGSVKSHNTISQLAGVPSGMHFPTYEYAVRRIIMDVGSPLAKILMDASYPWEPQLEMLSKEEADGREYYEKFEKFRPSKEMVPIKSEKSVVFECPIYQGQARPAQTVSAWEQFTLLATLQREWADNSVSCTVYFNPETEGSQVPNMLTSFVPVIKSVSMLPHTNGVYPQMPYEGISKDEYTQRCEALQELDWSALVDSDGIQTVYCENDRCDVNLEDFLK